ncbi:PspC domain-containing protein [Alteromonas pelagimontana]|uniref:PspC domain-containing protein n=1 Tax=Alteromonas pelagimontana TaxID=1858656 RepID=A0A6M4MEJ4_9ALTE|nr:PspC domain-containing protein [Alteromonas pelagimontana]QJR81611.1 PspC domain-containing protein [Alteromonas pelagimontana]
MKLPESDKRIYRDVGEAMISGVCAGVARYLSVDAVWVRAAAVAALFLMPGISVVAYIAAVFMLPRWSL